VDHAAIRRLASAEESTGDYRYLLAHGTTGLSVAVRLPTQMGLDSDHPMAAGKWAVGVAFPSLADMERLFAGIPLADLSTSMNHQLAAADPAGLLCPGRGAARGDRSQTDGTISERYSQRNYIARGHLYLSGRRRHAHITDIRVAGAEMPEWIRFRSRAITSAKRVHRRAGDGVHLCHAIAYIEAAMAAGLFCGLVRSPGFSFFFNSHNDFLEEIAKFRAARRIYATLMRDRFGATDPRS